MNTDFLLVDASIARFLLYQPYDPIAVNKRNPFTHEKAGNRPATLAHKFTP
jgi:hypothetical protein